MPDKPKQLAIPEPRPAGTDRTVCLCERCGGLVCIDPKPHSEATMLRRGKTSDGYCVDCAVHDWLRNTYPINIQLAESGPAALAHAEIQRQFEDMMRLGNADASPDEIHWDRIIANWERPFPRPVKPTAKNPVCEKQLQEISRRGQGPPSPSRSLTSFGDGMIRSFEELNALEPGLGDDLKQALDEQMGAESAEDADRIGQDLQD